MTAGQPDPTRAEFARADPAQGDLAPGDLARADLARAGLRFESARAPRPPSRLTGASGATP
jgi:hypothetical protein